MEHLTPRERFKRVLRGQPVDRLPMLGADGSVIPLHEWAKDHWIKQGMPADGDPMQRFGFDCADIPQARRGWEGIPLDSAAVLLSADAVVVDKLLLHGDRTLVTAGDGGTAGSIAGVYLGPILGMGNILFCQEWDYAIF